MAYKRSPKRSEGVLIETTTRIATKTDAARIACVGAAVWANTYATEGVTTAIARYIRSEFSEPRIASQLSEATRLFGILDGQDGLVGFSDIIFSETDSTSAEINRFYILERFCGQGHGRRLLEEMTERLFARGVSRIWLSVWAKNQRALRFYRSCGWMHTSDTRFVLDGVSHLNHVLQKERPCVG